MAKCEFCKNEVQKDQPCSNCGELICGYESGIVCAPDKGTRGSIHITKKYLIFGAKANDLLSIIIDSVLMYVLGALVGLIVSLVMGGVSKTRYGFIELKDVHAFVVEKPEGKAKYFDFKIILVDGREIKITKFAAKDREALIQKLAQTGIKIVDGNSADMAITKPYLTNTVEIRDCVCPSAASFLKLHKKQRVVPPVEVLITDQN